jgi:hypothetical protein
MKLKYRDIGEILILLAIIASVLAIPVITTPISVSTTYMEKVVKSEPYDTVESQQELVAHTDTIIDWKNGYSSYTPLQSYLMICFSLYPSESINAISSKSSSYIVETGGNLQKQKIKVSAKFDNASPFGIASDGSICIPKSGTTMQNCKLAATWTVNGYYDRDSQQYVGDNCPFVCFHNSPLLIPISSSSNPASVTLYGSQDWLENGCAGKLEVDLSKIDTTKIWFSMRLPPDYDQYALNIDSLSINYTWEEMQTEYNTVTKYRESQVEVPRQNNQTSITRLSFWQWLFRK